MANTVEYKLKISVPGRGEVKGASADVVKLNAEARKAGASIDRLGDESAQTARQVDKLGDEAAQTARQTAGLDTGARKAGQGMGAARVAAGGLAASLGGAALLGALTASIGKVSDFAQEVADLRNDLADASTRSGIAAETLQGLRLAAEGSGLSFGALTSGLDQFAGRVQQAGQGNNETARAFETLGVAVKDADGNMRDVDTVLQETLTALQGVEDGGTRSALAVDTLGRSGGKLMQALSGSELESFVALSREFGVDIGPKAAQSAGDWQRASAELDLVLRGLKGEIADAFGGGAEELRLFTDGIVLGFEIVKGAFRGFAAGVGDIVTTLTTPFSALLDAIEQTLTALDNLAQGDLQGAKDAAAAAVGSVGTAITSAPAMGLQVAGLVTGVSGVGLVGDAGAGALEGFERGQARVELLRQKRAATAASGPTEETPEERAKREEEERKRKEEEERKRRPDEDRRNRSAESAPEVRFVQGLDGTLDDVSAGFDDVFASLDPTFASLADAMDGLVGAFEQAAREFQANRTREITGAVVGTTQQVLSGNVGGALSAVGRDVGGVAGARLGTAGAVVGGLQFIGEQGAEGIEETLEGVKDGLIAALEALPQLIGEILPEFAASLIGDLIPALIENAPLILKSLLIDLPVALAEALAELLVGDEEKKGARIGALIGGVAGFVVAGPVGAVVGAGGGAAIGAAGQDIISGRDSRDSRSGRSAARSIEAGSAAPARAEDVVTMGTMRRRGRVPVVASNPFDGLAQQYDAQYGPYGRAKSTTIGGA